MYAIGSYSISVAMSMLLSLSWALPPDDLSRHRAGNFLCINVNYLTVLKYNFLKFFWAGVCFWYGGGVRICKKYVVCE